MDIQDIFTRVIEAGFYSAHPSDGIVNQSDVMQCALTWAGVAGVITPEEVKAGFDAINEYVSPVEGMSMRWTLRDCGLPHGPDDVLNLFQDWGNRPALKLLSPNGKFAVEVRDWRGETPRNVAAPRLGLPVGTLESIEYGHGFRYPVMLRQIMAHISPRD